MSLVTVVVTTDPESTTMVVGQLFILPLIIVLGGQCYFILRDDVCVKKVFLISILIY